MTPLLRSIVRLDVRATVLALVLAAVVVGVAIETSAALFGQLPTKGAVVGGVVGVVGIIWWRQRDYFQLSPQQRRECRRVQRTGVASHDRTIDQLALHRLQDMAGSAGVAERVVVVIVALVTSGLPIAAAIRMHSGWFLLGLVFAPYVAVSYWRRRRQLPVSQRLHTLSGSILGS